MLGGHPFHAPQRCLSIHHTVCPPNTPHSTRRRRRLGERTAAALRPRDCSALGCSARHTTTLWLLLLLRVLRGCGLPASGRLAMDESSAAVDIAPAGRGSHPMTG